MNGADAFLEALRSHGVDTLFGLPGSTEAPLLEALRQAGDIRYVLSLHEGVATAMADGYARASGRPAVVGLHTTVGTMNGMSQLFNAARDGVPVVMTAGHKDRTVLAEDGFCSFPDLAALLRPFTKRSHQTLSAEQIGPDLARALTAATAPPAGPTFLAVPEDLMAAPLERPLKAAQLPGVAHRFPPACDPAQLEAAARLLLSARRPLMVLGTAAASAAEPARQLAQELGMAVVVAELTDLARATYPTDSPEFLGAYGDQEEALEGCDLVLAAGCRMFYPFSARLRPRWPAGARLLHVHPDPSLLGVNLPTELAVAAEPSGFLEGVLRACRALGPGPGAAPEGRSWLDELARKRAASLGRELDASRGHAPTAVADLAAELKRVVPVGSLLVEEGVRASRLILRHLGIPREGELWRSSGGALGWGLPAAVGAKLAQPDRPVVLLVGDGTLHFSVQALWTAVAEKAGLVAVVLDNGGYLAVKRAIENMLGVAEDPREHPGTELPGIDHLAAARAYGARAVAATSASEVSEAVREGLAEGGVHVVVAPVARIRP